MAKAACWTFSDAEARKPGEQTGLDTPVVLALNDGYWVVDWTWVHSRSKSVKYPAWGVWSQG
jgi:hypothetical protein